MVEYILLAIHGNEEEHPKSTFSAVKWDVISRNNSRCITFSIGQKKARRYENLNNVHQMEIFDKTSSFNVLPPRTGNNSGFPADEEDQSKEADNSLRIPYRANGEAEAKYEDHNLEFEFEEKEVGSANMKRKIGKK